MIEVELWHIVTTEIVAVIETQATEWDAPRTVAVHRATHVPLGTDYQELDHPARRTSLNIFCDWPVPTFPDTLVQEICRQCGKQEPIWIGIPLCCKLPSFWGVDEPELLEVKSEVPE